MRSVAAPRTPRLSRGWYLAAVLSAVLAVGMCLLGWRQADQADRIAADPVRTTGVVTQVPAGAGTYSAVSYQADGRTLTAVDLSLPEDAQVGGQVCLERAADDPKAVRVCGLAYPQAAGIRLAQASVPVALLLCVLCVARIRRHRRVHFVRTTVALATEPPTRGRHSRRR